VASILIDDDVDLEWLLSKNKELQEVKLYIQQRRLAKLSPSSKPGWSCIVMKDGPLALKYE
jgi:hypothetical protein